jgi:hypothetical protein
LLYQSERPQQQQQQGLTKQQQQQFLEQQELVAFQRGGHPRHWAPHESLVQQLQRGTPSLKQDFQLGTQRRHLFAASTAATIPLLENGQGGIISTVSDPLSLSDMLCATAWKTNQSDPLVPRCRDPQPPNFAVLRYNETKFTPVRIPVVFHGK